MTTLYEYDAIGRQTKQTIGMNGNGKINATDLVTAMAYIYGTQDGKIVSITTQPGVSVKGTVQCSPSRNRVWMVWRARTN